MWLLSRLESFENFLVKIQKAFLVVVCVAMIIINIGQIAGRYLFFYSLPWSEQVSVVLFLLIVFMSQSLATRTDGEIRIDFLHNHPDFRRKLFIVSDIICLITLIILFASSIYLINHALRFRQVISSVQWQYAYVYCMIPVGFFLIFLSRLVVMLKRCYGTNFESALE